MTFRTYGTPMADIFDMVTKGAYGRVLTCHEVLDGFAAAMTEQVEAGTLDKELAEALSERAGFLTKKWLDEEAEGKDQASAS